MPNVLPIHALGDSHAAFFSGQDKMQQIWPQRSVDILPQFASYRLSATLAYSLVETDSSSKGREILHHVLDKVVPPGSTVLLCYGEIDCRAHILLQSEKQGVPVEDVVSDVADRYAKAVEEVVAKGFRTLVWGVIPSATEGSANWGYPTHGTCLERNNATKLFNAAVAERTGRFGVPVVTIFDKLVHTNGLTRTEFFSDEVHLSQRAMPFALEALGAYIPELQSCIQ